MTQTPTQQGAPRGHPTWVDLRTSDVDASQRFYGELFGWRFEDLGPQYNHYVMATLDGARVAALMTALPEQQADVWAVHLSTDDMTATAEAITAAGGQVLFGPHDLPNGSGAMGYATAPGGEGFGLWQDGSDPAARLAPRAVNRAGAPCYHELHTVRYAAAARFYPQAFGVRTAQVGDTDEFRYTQVLGDGDLPAAGIMDDSVFAAPDAPSVWETYFGATDVDACVERVERLGGRVLEQPVDTPYGRLARVGDSTGAVLRLLQVSSA